MRFEVSKVLDAIETRLTTDPALARAVVDLSEVVRYADLDGGRPASLVCHAETANQLRLWALDDRERIAVEATAESVS